MALVLRFSAGICALALGSGVAAGPAAARRPSFKISNYQVVYKGSGTYSVSEQGQGGSFTKVSSRFHWAVHYHLEFINRGGEQVAAISGPLSNGAGSWSISSDNGNGDTCTRNGGLKLNNDGAISGRVQPGGKVILHLVPGSNDYKTLDGSSGGKACDTTDFWHDWVQSFSKVGTGDTQVDPLTAFVKLSKAEQRAGKVIINVSNVSVPELTAESTCGGVSGGGASCHQTYEWKGSVTFKKQR